MKTIRIIKKKKLAGTITQTRRIYQYSCSWATRVTLPNTKTSTVDELFSIFSKNSQQTNLARKQKWWRIQTPLRARSIGAALLLHLSPVWAIVWRGREFQGVRYAAAWPRDSNPPPRPDRVCSSAYRRIRYVRQRKQDTWRVSGTAAAALPASRQNYDPVRFALAGSRDCITMRRIPRIAFTCLELLRGPQ